ncbi:MAG: hypothetical protein GXO23_03980 [Crenarchaeota archaeon]|nr:hypothetical protein [Thermoproteota archaeon]
MIPVRGDDTVVKRMAQLMRAGARLTSYSCPACGTPLLQLKTGEYYCARCNKQVVIVRSEEEEAQVTMKFGLAEVREAVFRKIIMLGRSLEKIPPQEVESLQEVTRNLLLLLEAFDKLNKIIRETEKERR